MLEKNNKTVWIISELYYPSETSTGFILTKLAEKMTANFDVNVLTGPTSYTGDSGKYSLKESVNCVDIERVKIPYLNKNSTFKRALRLLLVSLKLAAKFSRKVKRNDTIVVVTNPVPLLLFAAIYKKLTQSVNLVVIVHDIYPNNMLVAGLLSRKGIIYRTIDSLYTRTLRTADAVVVLGRDMKDVIHEKGITNSEVVENWAEIDRIGNSLHLSRNEVTATESDQKNTYNFLFAGNLGRVQGLPLLLDAIRSLPRGLANFTFAGGGACDEMVQEISKDPNSSVSNIGSFNRDDQSRIFDACDVGIVSLAPNMYGLGVPSKVYNLMAAGKPILYIGDINSEIDLVIKEYDCGWSVTDITRENIIDTFIKISEISKNELDKKGQNAFRLANEKYTLANAALKYNDILSSLS